MKPKIRFKGYGDDINYPSLDEIFEVRNGYTPSKAISDFWTNGSIPWFRMEDLRRNGGILKDAIQHITPQAVKGELFQSYSIIVATTATIGEHAMLIADSLANQQFTNFSIRKSLKTKYDPFFVYYSFFKLDEWAKKNTNSGGLLSVDIGSMLKQTLSTPSLPEQKKIAKWFQSLDKLILSSMKKIESLKQIKAASMQAMFPQEGETSPKVRFEGFEDEWVKKNFGEVFYYLKNNSLSRDCLAKEGTVKNIHYGDILIKFGATVDPSKDTIPNVFDIKLGESLHRQCALEDGDILFADAAEDSTVGKCVEIKTKESKIIAGLHTIPCRTKFQFADGFLGYYLNSSHFHNQLLPFIQGSKVSSISRTSLELTYLCYPSSITEQKQIASFFANLDTQISLQTQQLEKLKQIKAACLDQMFV